MLDIITQAPLLAATILACQLIALAEFWMYLTLHPVYFRLSLPLSGVDLPHMPLHATSGERGTVKWDGDAQLIRFRHRIDLFGRHAYGHGLLERTPDGTIRASWAPFPGLTFLLSLLPVLALILQLGVRKPALLVVFFLLGGALHVWLARRAVLLLLAELKDALESDA